MKSCVIMGTGSLNMSYKTSSRPFCREKEMKSAPTFVLILARFNRGKDQIPFNDELQGEATCLEL